MAELGAHLATATTEFPSIFEILAQDNLSSTLRPAFSHLVKVIAQKFPERLGWLYCRRDEFYIVLDSLLQHHFLKTRGASFAEDFYGLKRVVWGDCKTKADVDSGNYALPIGNHLRSLGCLVFAPYMKQKLENYLNEREGQISPPTNLVRLLQLLHFILESLGIIYLVGYSVGKNPFATQFLHFTDTILQTLAEDDELVSDSRGATGKVGNAIVKVFSVATFFLQFLDWWYISGNAPTLTHSNPVGDASLMPPPKPMIQHGSRVKTGTCPICEQEIRNPTVLSNSGFVFCYVCIHTHIQKEHLCPVTGLPTKPHNLVRLYVANSV